MAELVDPRARLLDPARLAAVQLSGLLDTAPEPVFDDLARMAGRLLDAPLALITVVDDRRSYRKSYVAGAMITHPVSALREIPVEESLCRFVIGSGARVMVGHGVSSLADDAQLTIGGMEIRSWVGYPVLSPDGQVIGTFAVADPAEREWTELDLEALRTLTRSVSTEIAGRQLTARAQASRRRSLELSAAAQHLRRQNTALIAALRQSLVPPGRWRVGPLDVAVSVAAGAGALASAVDFMDVSGVGSGRWGVALGHVHDQSVAAAATAVFARQVLRAQASAADSPAAVLRAADHAVFDRAPFGPPVSCTSLWLAPAEGRLSVQAAGAGGLVPAIRAANGRLRWLGESTSPLGNEIGPRRALSHDDLTAGDVLVLVNLAVLTATGPGGSEPFGADRLAGVLRVTGTQGPAQVARAVTDAAVRYAGENRTEDLVALVVQPAAGRGR